MRYGGRQSPDYTQFKRLWTYSKGDGEASGGLHALEQNRSKEYYILKYSLGCGVAHSLLKGKKGSRETRCNLMRSSGQEMMVA